MRSLAKLAGTMKVKSWVYKLLMPKFNNDYKAVSKWLNTSHPKLGNKTPFELILEGKGAIIRELIQKGKLP